MTEPRIHPYAKDSPIPLVVEPAEGEGTLAALRAWLRDRRAWLHQAMVAHNAILFRGFAVEDARDFEVVAEAIDPDLLPYVEGAALRAGVDGTRRVYTSTEWYPPLAVDMHHEMAYATQFPGLCFFYCDVAPTDRGETPLCDSRRVHAALPEPLRRRFETRGVRYVRRMPRTNPGYYRSWPETFETEDRARVEVECRARGIDFTWLDGDVLATSETHRAVVRHPLTGAPLWFNQAHAYHPSNLTHLIRMALLESAPAEIAHGRGIRVDVQLERTDRLGFDCTFGDGTPIDPEDLHAVRAACARHAVTFPWRRGDVLVVDNLLTMHGRRPFSGPRRILVAMAQKLDWSTLGAP